MRFTLIFFGLLCVTPARSLEVTPAGTALRFRAPTAVPVMQSIGYTVIKKNAQMIRPRGGVVFTKSELCSAAAAVATGSQFFPCRFSFNLIRRESHLSRASLAPGRTGHCSIYAASGNMAWSC